MQEFTHTHAPSNTVYALCMSAHSTHSELSQSVCAEKKQRIPNRMRMDRNTAGTKRSRGLVMGGAELGREAPLQWKQNNGLKQTQLTNNLT